MAYVAQDDTQKQNQNQQDPNASMGAGGAPVSGGQGAGGAVGGGSQPQAYGQGGTGGWTNIQNYLNANKNTTGSAQALNKTVGSSFDNEQSNLNQQASDTKSQGQAAVDKNNVSKDAASQMIQAAGSQYQYTPQAGVQQNGAGTIAAPSIGPSVNQLVKAPTSASFDPNANPSGQSSQTNQTPAAPANPYAAQSYDQIVNGLKGALSAQYGGPSNFTYNMSADAQNYGQGLGNDQGFQGVMQGIYNQAAGGHMGSGALALQSQLDTNNDAVNQARQNLLQKYSGLTGNITNATNDVNQALQGDQSAFSANQKALKDYLSGLADTNKSAIDQAVGNWNSEEAKDYSDQQNRARALDLLYGQGFAEPFVHSGGTAAADNIGGVDDQRNQYNALMDALGNSDRIGKGAVIGPHGAFDQTGEMEAEMANRIKAMAQQAGQG